MAKEAFIERRFTADSLATIARVNAILDEYAGQGFRLSLRQLYYQLVARGIIPNSVRSYKNVGNLVSDARLAGLVDWDMIEDRGRELVVPAHWGSPADILDSAAYSYRTDKWADQPSWVVVMVEKDALSGVLTPVCRTEDVAFIANKGYSSSSAMYDLGKRLQGYADDGKELHVLYLGDHDPSGIDMTRDVRERLNLFTYEADVIVQRLALNYDQIAVLNPPPNPAKETDSRFESYLAEYGDTSWELDAIEPAALATIVRNAIDELRDPDRWEEAVAAEEQQRALLRGYAAAYRKEHWDGRN